MSAIIQINGVVREQWTDTLDANGNVTSGTYTAYDATGTQVSTRAYNTAEIVRFQADASAVKRQANLQTIFTAMQNARSNNATFLGFSPPTTAQAVAQVQALTRQSNGIMRVLYGLLWGDASALDGTN